MVITQKITSMAFEIHDGELSICRAKLAGLKECDRCVGGQWPSEPGSEHKHSYVTGL